MSYKCDKMFLQEDNVSKERVEGTMVIRVWTLKGGIAWNPATMEVHMDTQLVGLAITWDEALVLALG